MILKKSLLQNVIDAALSNGADFAEVYAENTYEASLGIKSSQPSEGTTGRLYGAGIRLFYGTEIIYTYTNDLTEAALIKTAQQAAQAITSQNSTSATPLSLKKYDSIHKYSSKPWDMPKDKKISMLLSLDKLIRQESSDITQVDAVFREVMKQVQIANSEGLLISETRQYSTHAANAIMERNGIKESAHQRRSTLGSNEYFESIDYNNIAKEIVRICDTNIKADYAPAGEMPVVLNNGFGGVIFHEACGHGLETTSIAKNSSVFCGKLGERIARDCVTAIDDGTVAKENGSLAIDDEGMETQKTTLIKDGILNSYIVDKMGEIQTGYQRTGSGRRQDYRYAPASRMRNTFIANGKSSLEEMISDIDHGIYAANMGGGSVTPGTGAFNFAVKEAYLIKNGKIDQPVKGASLIGTGIETLGRITKVGNNFQLAPGTCGSVSGWIPTTVGQPAIQVEKMTVGGRA